MRSRTLRKFVITLMTGGFLFAQVSCIPNRDAFNSMISSSILNGIGLVITLGIQSVLTPGTDETGTDTTDTTDTTTDQTATQ